MTKFYLKKNQLTELDKLMFVPIVTLSHGNKNSYKSCFTHCIYEPILVIVTFVTLNYLQLCNQNASIIPQNLVFKHKANKLE